MSNKRPHNIREHGNTEEGVTFRGTGGTQDRQTGCFYKYFPVLVPTPRMINPFKASMRIKESPRCESSLPINCTNRQSQEEGLKCTNRVGWGLVCCSWLWMCKNQSLLQWAFIPGIQSTKNVIYQCHLPHDLFSSQNPRPYLHPSHQTDATCFPSLLWLAKCTSRILSALFCFTDVIINQWRLVLLICNIAKPYFCPFTMTYL